jgi:type VI secretion system protein ImpH
MAGENRGPAADLSEGAPMDIGADLFDRGWSYSFFQAVRLLRRMHSDVKEAGGAPDDHIRVRPDLNLSFPAADIAKIEADESGDQKQFRITTTFFGLYGTSSPLPTFYTEDLILEAGQDESVSRDFLDIIHHRLYGLLFQAWMKYRLFFQVAEAHDDQHLERLFCLLGLGEPELRRDMTNARGLLRYIGLFTQFPHSAAGLITMLRDALGEVPLQIVPCIRRMAAIPEPQRLKMGISGSRLGMDSYVGEAIEDRMGKFRIQIGPMNQAAFLDFTPGQPGYAKLTALTAMYVTEPLEYEVELVLAANQAQTARLGDPVRSVLGVTTWVFSEASLGEVRTRFKVDRG